MRENKKGKGIIISPSKIYFIVHMWGDFVVMHHSFQKWIQDNQNTLSFHKKVL